MSSSLFNRQIVVTIFLYTYKPSFKTQKGSKIIFLAINNVCQRGLYLQTYYNFVKERQCPIMHNLIFKKIINELLLKIYSN